MSIEENTAVPPWDSEDDQPPPAPPVQAATPFGHIILGMIAGFAAGFFLPRLLGASTALVPALVIALVAASIGWGVGFLLAFRRAAPAWIGGSFLMMLVAALLGANASVAAAKRARHADRLAYASLVRGADGRYSLPEGIEAGPVTKAQLVVINAMQDAAGSRDRRIQALGGERLLDPVEVLKTPALVRDCDRFLRAVALVDATTQTLVSIDARRAAIPTFIQDPGASVLEAIRVAHIAAHAQAIKDFNWQAEVEKGRLEASGTLCHILAESRWTAESHTYRFSDDARVVDFNSAAERYVALGMAKDARIRSSVGQIEQHSSDMRESETNFPDTQ
jgi:hypothetical protein